MIKLLTDKINKLKWSSNENNTRQMIESKMVVMGYNGYNEKFLNGLKMEFPKLVRFYEMGNELKLKEN